MKSDIPPKKTLKIVLSSLAGSLLLITHPTIVNAQESLINLFNGDSDLNAKTDPYDFSGDGRSGRRTSGGSRGDCSQLESNLIALTPTSNSGKTVSDYPTWWFNVPYSSEETPIGVFVLQDENYNDIYRRQFTLPPTPGLVSVSLPPDSASLVVGESYRWQFNLYCGRDRANAPLYVSGWITRVSPEISLKDNRHSYQSYANQGIWFDTINHLLQLRSKKPNDIKITQDWYQLLEAKGVGLEEIKNAPIAGTVQFQ